MNTKNGNLRYKPACFAVIVVTIVLLVIVVFFRDRFLFFLLGFDSQLTKSTSVESFKAYSAIQNWRLGLAGLTLLSGVVCFLFCRVMEKTLGNWYFVAGKILGMVTCLLMLVILTAYMFLPKRLLWVNL